MGIIGVSNNEKLDTIKSVNSANTKYTSANIILTKYLANNDKIILLSPNGVS